jgi:hypothetical protein
MWLIFETVRVAYDRSDVDTREIDVAETLPPNECDETTACRAVSILHDALQSAETSSFRRSRLFLILVGLDLLPDVLGTACGPC